jgi:hypothetical protein
VSENNVRDFAENFSPHFWREKRGHAGQPETVAKLSLKNVRQRCRRRRRRPPGLLPMLQMIYFTFFIMLPAKSEREEYAHMGRENAGRERGFD